MFFALLLALLAGIELFRDFVPAKLSVGFVIAFWVPLLVIHEAGHALVARALGWSVSEMVIGFGPEVMRFRVGEMRVVVRLVPVEGYVVPVPDSLMGARGKNALVYFGGPGAELLVIALLGFGMGWDALLTRSDQVGVIALQSFGVAAALGVFMTLVPHAGAGGASDGLGMLLSASMPDDHFSYRMALPDSQAAVRLLEQGRTDDALRLVDEALTRLPEHPLLLATRARCLGASGDTQGARQVLEALRARSELADIFEAERLHAAACLVLEAETLGDAQEAIAACREALKLAPGLPGVLVTLGALQHRAGDHREALQSLMLAYKSTREPLLEDRCLAHLAASSRALGNSDDARLFADTLRSRTQSQRLLQIVHDC